MKTVVVCSGGMDSVTLAYHVKKERELILRDRHPIELTARHLTNEVQLPIVWEDQHTLLGTT